MEPAHILFGGGWGVVGWGEGGGGGGGGGGASLHIALHDHLLFVVLSVT